MRAEMRKRALVVAMLAGLSGCITATRSDGTATGDRTVSATQDSSDTGQAVSASSAPADPPPGTESSGASSAGSASSTPDGAATTAPDTSVPVTATQLVVPADAADAEIESVSDVVSNDDKSAAYLAGQFQDAPGEPSQATVWVTDGRARKSTLTLDPGKAEEAWANGIASRGKQVVVAGAIRTGDNTVGVIWQSDDGGASFGSARVIDKSLKALTDIAFNGESLVAVGTRQPAGKRPRPVALVSSGDRWSAVGLEGPAKRWVESVTVNGPAITVTGGAEVDGVETAMLWLSGDNGQKFSAIDSVNEYRSIGAVSAHDGSYITTARGKDDDPMVILSSDNGIKWKPTEVKLTWNGDFFASQYEGGERVVVAGDGSYVTEVGTGFGFIGRISQDGRGVATDIFSGRLQATESLLPFEVGGQVSVISNTERSFSIFSETDDGWKYSGRAGAEGPTVTFTKLRQVGGEIAAIATSYPKVTNNGSQQGPSNFWSRYDGSAFEPMTGAYLPGDVSSWAANDEVEVALNSGATDPNDDRYGGPTGATMAWTRALPDGKWSDQEMILTGPGGDYLDDLDRLGPGFVAVGRHAELGADQIFTGTPVIMEYLDETWATASLPRLNGTSIALFDVVGAPSGLALAIGTSNGKDVIGPLLLSRDTDGAWSKVDLPVKDAGAVVINAAFTDDRFELLIDDAGTYAVISSTDGEKFKRNNLKFEDPFIARPAATARVDGVTYVVGVSGYENARRLAVWRLGDKGSLSSLEVGGDAPIGTLQVDSVVTSGSDIWVGGETEDLGVVWKLKIVTTPSS